MDVTIIIPVYNGAEYLKNCIGSCITQSHKNLEILIINDGSTDFSEQIIKDFEKHDSRVRHINQTNQGLVKSRKIGAKEAKNDYILFLDADDVLDSDAVEKLVAQQRKTNSDIVFANFIIEFANGAVISYSNNNFQGNFEAEHIFSCILKKQIAPTIWGKLIRKSLFSRTDVPDYMTIGEDAIAISQLLFLMPKISAINDHVYHYVQRDESMVNIRNKNKNMKRLCFMDFYKGLVLNSPYKSNSIEQELKHFMISEIFDILRDGGNLKDINVIYKWITENNTLYSYKNTIGFSRMLLVESFVISEPLGTFFCYSYNILRNIRNKLLKFRYY